MTAVRAENQDRGQRILDAALRLFVHYGYDKTTVSDIAREAGISKGAIYLHFKSKDELFEALLKREMEQYTQAWMDELEADPKGGTVGAMYKSSLVAMNRSPFMAVIFKQDKRVLGNYLRKPDNIFRQHHQHSPREYFVAQMQAVGAIRPDMDAKIIAHIMDLFSYGIVTISDVMPKEAIPPLDQVFEGIAEIMDRALTPADGGNSEAGKQIVRQLVDAARQHQAALDEAKAKESEQ